jgi:hypothetical protein
MLGVNQRALLLQSIASLSYFGHLALQELVGLLECFEFTNLFAEPSKTKE